MKHYSLGFCVFLVTATFTQSGDLDANLKDALLPLRDLTETIKPAKDQKSADDVVKKLKSIKVRLTALEKKDERTPRLPLEECQELTKKYGTEFDAVLNAMDAEVTRTIRVLELKSPLLEELDLFKEMANRMNVMTVAKASAAVTRISTIDKALQSHKTKTGKFPESLEVLSQGKNAALKEKDLWDPWEKPYCYNPSGTFNQGKLPDVWTTTPLGEKIGNWT